MLIDRSREFKAEGSEILAQPSVSSIEPSAEETVGEEPVVVGGDGEEEHACGCDSA